MTREEFDRTLGALYHAVRHPSKHKSLQRSAESWQVPPRTIKQIKQLGSMTFLEIWELSQQLKELNK